MHTDRSRSHRAGHAALALVSFLSFFVVTAYGPTAHADLLELEGGFRFGGGTGLFPPQPNLLVGLRLGERVVLSTGATFGTTIGDGDGMTMVSVPLALKLYLTEPVDSGIVPIARFTAAYDWVQFENALESHGLSTELAFGAQLFVTPLIGVLLEGGVGYSYSEVVEASSGWGAPEGHGVYLMSRLALVLRP